MTRLRKTVRTKRRHTALVALLVILGGVFALVPSATAVHDLGIFELDRNAQDPGGAALPDDWATLFGGGGGADDFTGVLDDIGVNNPSGGAQFQGGGSKDDLDITQWLWKDGEPLDKDDITNAYAAAYTNTNDTGENNVGDLIIYYGLDRFSANGSAQVGFWFLQDPTFGLTNTSSGGGFEFSGQHQDNDVLVQSNFSGGGVIDRITVYKWVSGSLVQVTSIPPVGDCLGPPASPNDDAACGTVNRSPQAAPWPYTPKANEGSPGTFLTGAFFEGGINITRLIPAASCFTAFTAETRTSTPFDARLKDFVVGDLDTCVRDVRVLKTPDDGQANAGDTISFSMNVKNIGTTSAANVTLSDNLPDSGLDWAITSQPTGDPCAISGAVGSQVLSCNFGTLAVDAERIVTISSATDSADCGAKPNSVTVSATGDIDATNNTDTGQITVNCAAIRILKNSTKGGAVNNAGAVFSITGAGISGSLSVTDDTTAAAPDEDADIGEVCVSGLQPGSTYTVNETSPPSGYGDASELNVTVVAVAGNCSTADLNSATFSNPPLSEFVIDFNDLGSGETSADISCTGLTPTPPDGNPGFNDDVETYTNLVPNPSPGYVCTIKIDP